MKITKYIQSCLLIEVKGKRILIDPGSIGISSNLIYKDWINIDIILITHKHSDHIDVNSVRKIVERDKSVVYTSQEVLDAYPMLECKTVKVGDILDFEGFKIEVTKAVHGYLPQMKDNEVIENLGYIIDDSIVRVYVTSDTISFNNDYHCDVICMPFTGNGLMFGIFDGCLYARAAEAKLVIPVHFEHPTLKVDKGRLTQALEENKLNYKLLENGETIEF